MPIVAHADPDGYTVLYGTSSLAVNATLYHALDYDPIADLAPVSLVAKFPFFMFVPNSSPAKTVMEFVAYAKAHPGKLIMGSPGTGSAPHLAEELFLQMAEIQMTHAPYRGAAPAFIDLIPGRIDCYFGSGELLTYSRSGQVRALGTTGSKSGRRRRRNCRPSPRPAFPAMWSIPGRACLCRQRRRRTSCKKMSADIVAALAEPATRRASSRAPPMRRSGSSPEELREFSESRCRKVERRHQDGGLEDRLILHRLAADLADHLHPLLNLIEGALIFGTIARWLRLRLDIDGLGHDLSHSDYWHSDRVRRCRRRH